MRESSRAAWRTAVLVARSDRRRWLQTAALSAAAAATGLLVLLVVLAATAGAGNRAQPAQWRTPVVVADTASATAWTALTTSQLHGEPLTVARFAQTAGSTLRPPAGVGHLPGPGEVLASPALVEAAASLSPAQVAQRFPAPPASWGVLGDEALATPDELVALVGVEPGDPSLAAALVADPADPTTAPVAGAVSGFRTAPPGDLTSDLSRTLMALGAALLVIPVLVLVAAGGRLAGTRREVLLARLRLAGATPHQAALITATENLLAGTVGAVVAVLAYLALLPALAQVRWAGHPWFVSDLLVAPGVVLVAAATVVLVLVGAALSTLRAVIGAPLGVAQLQDARSTRLTRLLLAVGVVGLAVLAARFSDGDVLVQLGAVVAVLAALNLVGPFVVDRLGRLVARLAPGPAGLLAGRSLSGDPRSAWRVVSGIVLAGFAAGFFSVVTLGAAPGDGAATVVLPVAASDAPAVLEQARARVDSLDEDLVLVAVAEPFDLGLLVGPEVQVLGVTTTGDPAQVDRVVGALAALAPGQPAFVPASLDADLAQSLSSMRDLMIGVLALSLVLALVSTALTSVASLVERREEHRSMRTLGMGLRVVRRTRTLQTLLPLVVLCGLTILSGAGIAGVVNDKLGTSADPGAPLTLVAFLGAGVALMALVLRATSRTLARSTVPGEVA